MSTPAVALEHITRRFGPVIANDDVSLDLKPGEIHALIGENGAGKSTLMRVLYGLIQPNSGHIKVSGRKVRIRRPADAIHLGLGMVHQHFMLVDPLTVAENVTLGAEPSAMLGNFRRIAAVRAVEDLAGRLHLAVDPRSRIASLSIGSQQRVEILKTLYHGARLLILDEPSAVLTPHEVDELFQMLRMLKAQGTTIVFITHKLNEVKAIADRVTVMRAGRVVGEGPVGAMPSEQLAELMVGHPLAPLHERVAHPHTSVLLQVRGLEVHDDRGLPAVRSVAFDVHAGEIVGIAGVEGNGQHELLESLAGLRPPVAGEIVIAGQRCSGRSAREHFTAGVAHIPSDRLRRGLVPDMTLAENLVLGLHREPGLGRGPWLDPRIVATRASRLLEAYDVRPREPAVPAATLSGGNQQKLIAARELSRGAPVMLAAHPTRGVDLGAIAFIHRQLLDERNAGHAVLLVSSELSEILSLSDRVFVMYEGKLVHETRPDETDERTLGLVMTGRRPGDAEDRT